MNKKNPDSNQKNNLSLNTTSKKTFQRRVRKRAKTFVIIGLCLALGFFLVGGALLHSRQVYFSSAIPAKIHSNISITNNQIKKSKGGGEIFVDPADGRTKLLTIRHVLADKVFAQLSTQGAIKINSKQFFCSNQYIDYSVIIDLDKAMTNKDFEVTDITGLNASQAQTKNESLPRFFPQAWSQNHKSLGWFSKNPRDYRHQGFFKTLANTQPGYSGVIINNVKDQNNDGKGDYAEMKYQIQMIYPAQGYEFVGGAPKKTAFNSRIVTIDQATGNQVVFIREARNLKIGSKTYPILGNKFFKVDQPVCKVIG